MTQSHTPGPWQYGGPVDRDGPGLRRFPSMPSRYYEIGLAPVDFPPGIACAAKEADACLVAAAPELYEVLGRTLVHLEDLADVLRRGADDGLGELRLNRNAALVGQIREKLARATLS